ncbi:MAG: ribosome-associated translation inhibitor RaiA [Simkaniaceae bacterium]
MGKVPQFVKEQSEAYTVTISSKNVEITPPMKDYIMEKIEKIERLTKEIMEIDVRLTVQKLSHQVDIILKFGHLRVKVHAITDNMYASIDKAFERMMIKLRKWKEQIQNHHAKSVSTVDLKVNVLHKPSDLFHPDAPADRGSPEFIQDSLEEKVDSFNESLEEKEKQQYSLQNWFPEVVRTKKRVLKILTVQEAVMKMELSDDAFMLYKGEEDQKLKIIYRRRDGSYGIIEIVEEKGS